MNIALSFIGKLPAYTVECVHQIRLFTSQKIYLILNDFSSPYIEQLKPYDVTFVDSTKLDITEFNECIQQNKNKFHIVHGLTGRELLFIRAFERFFLLQALMKRDNIENVLFMEIDNLIYDNPDKWLSEMSKHELCYMFDNIKRCASGIMYIKKWCSLNIFTKESLNFISTSKEFLNEMTVLWNIADNNSIDFLPVFWKEENIHEYAHRNFGKYDDSIFDAAGLGIYIGGFDPFHTGGVVQKFPKKKWSQMDYTTQQYIWKVDNEWRNIPYIKYNDKWLRINNLHIHSKKLKDHLSK